MKQFYRIAGLTVQMDTFGRTLEQARPYLCEESAPDVTISGDWKAFQAEYPQMSMDDSEYMVTARSFYRQLLLHEGFMLHSSAVVVDGKAYLFSAPSGTGKSTHTGLWLERFGDRALILNDDKPALRREQDGWYAYGTPWSGKHDISRNLRVPVAGIAMIRRSETNEITPYTGKEAVYDVFSQVNRPKGMALRVRLLDLLDKLFAEVPVWQLKCNISQDAVTVSYEAMSGKTKQGE